MKNKFNIGDTVRHRSKTETPFKINYIRVRTDGTGLEYHGEKFVWYHESLLIIVKPKRKITLYRYTYEGRDEEILQTFWKSTNFKDYGDIIKTETKEIEIDDA